MKTRENKAVGTHSISVEINIADSIKLSTTLDRLDRYDELCKVGDIDTIDPETGEIVTMDPIQICHKEGFEPIDELMNLRKFCKKFCFVELSDSNVFDDEEKSEEKK